MDPKIGEKFESQDFSGKDLTAQVFEDCSFAKCSFKGANLSRARFLDCAFTASDLSNSTLTSARLREASFDNCKLLGLQWVSLEALVNPTFKECNLSYGNFIGLSLKKTVFQNCILRETDFSQSDLSESDFQGSDLLNARFKDTVLLKADFRKATNYLIDPTENKVRGARFSLPEAQGLLVGLGIILE